MQVPRLRLFAFALVAALTLASAALAAALHTETATLGDTTATFSFHGQAPTTTGLRLRITKAGSVRYDKAVVSGPCGSLCGPGSFDSSPSVKVLALESGAPDVVLELYSGGANCCFIDQVFSFSAGTGTYVTTEHDFGSAGAVIKQLAAGHGLVFLSADNAFKYAFTDGADSGQPVQIWSFAARHFKDVTQGYRAQVKRDAARWYRLFTHHYGNGEGFLAAWAADEERLGKDKLVQATLASALAHHHLHAGTTPIYSPKNYIRALNRLLRTLGYKKH